MKAIVCILTFLTCLSIYALDVDEKAFLASMKKLQLGQHAQGLADLATLYKQGQSKTVKGKVAYILFNLEKERKDKVINDIKEELGLVAFFEHPSLSDQSRALLGRSTADIFFEKGQLEKAQDIYNAMVELKEASEEIREYALYKLGWVYANDHVYGPLLALWNQWIAAHPKGVLRENLLHDYGKFYVEYHTQNKVDKTDVPSLNLAADSKDAKHYQSGLAQGYSRLYKKSPIYVLNALKQDPSYTHFLNIAVSNSRLFSIRPCKTIPYITQAQAQYLDHKVVGNTVLKCSKKMAKSKKLKKAYSHDIQLAFNMLDLGGKQSFAKATYFVGLGQKQKACQIYQKGLAKNEEKKEKEHKLAFINNLKGAVKTCQSLDQMDLSAIEMLLSNPRYLKEFKASKLIQNLYYALLVKKGQHNRILGLIVNRDKAIQVGIIKAVYATASLSAHEIIQIHNEFKLERDELAGDYLWAVKKLIEEKSYQIAHDALNKMGPPSAKNIELSKLWFLLASSDFEKSADFPSSKTIEKALAQGIFNSKSDKKDLELATHLILKNNNSSELIANWAKYRKRIKSTRKTKLSFIAKVLGEKGPLNFPNKSKDKLLSYVRDLYTISTVPSRITKYYKTPKSFRRSAVGKDGKIAFRVANSLRKLERKGVSPETILQLAQKANTLVTSLQKHNWSEAKLQNAATAMMKKFLSGLAKNMQDLAKKDKTQAQDLLGLANLMKQWEAAL